MLRRLSLIILLIAAVGAGVAIASGAAQKDKAKSKDQPESKEQVEKEKEKALLQSPGLFGLELGAGEGGYLGVYLEEVTPERTRELGLKEERGAVVMKVVADSPAAKSGLKENDVIVSFNGRRVDSVRELQRLLNETPADRTVQIEIVRGNSRQTLATALAKRSLQSFKSLGPEFNEKFWKQNEESMKRAEESLKLYEETMKEHQGTLKALPPNFGDFAFVNPGEYSFFSGRRLGISAESLTDQLAEFFGVKDSKGVLVASVDENSSAAKAGIKAGDVIIAIENEKVDSVRALVKALSAKTEGPLAVKIVRNRAEQTLNVTLEKRELPTTRRPQL
ncbi:MAG: PDZ domain-containing protein [Acidobacteriota bacterium]